MIQHNSRFGCWLLAASASMALLTSPLASAADNMRFHGALVAEPCMIPPGQENVQLDFGAVLDKNLYQNKRTHSQPFVLTLAECDLSVGKTVRITFSGIENPNLPGLLKLSGSSQASGIGIGMETKEGKPLPINKESQNMPLSKNNTTLEFKAYVQGEPDAIAKENIVRGPFSAVATIGFEYE